jgi:phage repressor protein C with HTH and peptisase S24 domain
MGNILTRIQELSTNESITLWELERQIGASRGVLARALKNGTDVQSKWLQLIAEKYPQYSTDWLLTGKGEMLNTNILDDIDEEELSEDEKIDASARVKSPIKQRILQLLDKEGISQHEFYKNTGITRGILSQDNGISESNIARILNFYRNVNVGWLVTGVGEMFVDEKKETNKTNLQEKCSVAIHTTNGNEGIPLIPIEAMAGIFTGENIINEYECDRYIVPAFKGADFLITVKGNSMHPKYSTGDIVACQRVPMSDLFFQWNKVYVIDTNQGALIKRINPGCDKNHVLIVSENKDYPPFELPYTSIHGVAIVVGVIRLE